MTQSENGKPIPHDPELERAVLGIMLSESVARKDALDLLGATDFYTPRYASLFENIAGLHDRGLPIDALTLGIEPHVVLDLSTSYGSAYNIAGYATQLRDLRVMRAAVGLSIDLDNAARDRDVEMLHKILDQAREVVVPNGVTVEPSPDWLNMAEEDHTPDWIIRDLLARTETVAFVGEPGHGKTLLLWQFGAMLASGIHPFLRTQTTARKVLAFNFQDARQKVGDEMARLRRAVGTGARPGMAVELRQQGIDLTRPRDQAWFEAKVASARPDLIIAGPLYNMVAGAPGRSKQSEETAELAGHFIVELLVKYGAAMILEAHAPHGDELRIRGAKYWEDWARFGFGLVAEKTTMGGRAMRVTRFRGDGIAGRRWPTRYVEGIPDGWPWVVPDGHIPAAPAPRAPEIESLYEQEPF